MPMPTDATAVARLYLKEKTDQRVIVNIPGTQYELYLEPTAEVVPNRRGRVKGVIRCPVWKMDRVSAGGAFIEPVIGRPRRLQGQVIATIPETNSVVVELAEQPVVGDLPERYSVAEIAIGDRVGLDVYAGATFEPVTEAAAV